MIGQTVSHYRVLEKLGEGGMGVVYLAEDTRLGRRVALKALSPEFARDPDRRKRFQQEARAAAVLTHPGIATVYELEEVGEDLFIAFEYVRGDNLRAAVNRGPMELETLLKAAADIARALAAAHSHGIVHRDLKPENVIRTAEGDSKILDFGLARFQPTALEADNASTRLTDPGSIVGTISYMAPEQLESKDADFRSDIFAFGILVYELATGMRPFEGTSRASTISRILSSEPVPLAQRNPVAPPELDRIVRKCLRKRPEERYQSTRDLVVDLESLRRESGEVSSSTIAEADLEEPTLLRRLFTAFGAGPRRWWELQHLAAVFGFFPLYIYVGTKLKQHAGSWSVPLFIALLVFAATSISLRSYVLVSAAFNPRGLIGEIRRVRRFIHASTYFFMAVLGFMAVMAFSADSWLAGWALGLAVAGAILSLVMEPTLDRAAFPQLASAYPVPKEQPAAISAAQTNILGLIVLLHAVYYGFAIYSLLTPKIADRRGETIAFVILLGAGISAATGVEVWRGKVREAQRLSRWFPLYFLLDVTPLASILWLRMDAVQFIPLPIAILIFALPLYARWHQRQLARKLLPS